MPASRIVPIIRPTLDRPRNLGKFKSKNKISKFFKFLNKPSFLESKHKIGQEKISQNYRTFYENSAY